MDNRRVRPPRRRAPVPIVDVVSQRYNRFLAQSTIDADGNAYKETIVRMPGAGPVAQHRSWEKAMRDREVETGAQTLSMCVRKMLNNNLQELSVEALQALDWRYGRMIWRDAEATRRSSFEIWAMFREAYKDTPEADILMLRRYTLSPEDPILPVLPRISSSGFAYLVILDLRASASVSRADLIDISGCPNLGSIHLANTEKVDDTVLRMWSRAAVHSGRLSRLWYLSSTDCPLLTPVCLEYLLNIPSLRVVDLSGCGNIRGSANGWVQVRQDEELVPLQSNTTVDDTLAAMWKRIFGADQTMPRLYVSWNDGILRSMGRQPSGSKSRLEQPGAMYRRDLNFQLQKRSADSAKGAEDSEKGPQGEPVAKRRVIRRQFQMQREAKLSDFLIAPVPRKPPRR